MMKMTITNNLIEAIKDLRYLLSRGYKREGAVRFVGDKNGVTLAERYILIRAVYDEEEAETRKRKLVDVSEINNKLVSIDGYNLLITVESMLDNKPLIHCDDHITRDISAVFGKHRITTRTTEALRMILQILRQHKPDRVHFYYDKQVSRSGELASKTRTMMADFELAGTATTATRSDVATLRSAGIIVSSDCVIVQRANNILDLAGDLARQISYHNIVQLPPRDL